MRGGNMRGSDMGKKLYAIITGLSCAVLATACQAAGPGPDALPSGLLAELGLVGVQGVQPVPSQARLRAEQEQYAQYIDDLDRMRSEIAMQQAESEVYRETIGSIYLFDNAYSGGLRASHDDEHLFGFELLMTGTEGDVEVKQRYECVLLPDGSMWSAYQNESSAQYDLPDYVVNEDVLRFGRVNYVYDDGTTDIEAEKEQRRQELDRYLADDVSAGVQEFWHFQDRLYRIDRKGARMIDVTDEKEQCIAAFLQEQRKRIDCQLDVSAEHLKIVERYKPEGYSLLWEDDWSDIAACDLNGDGRSDLVAVLYPDDHEQIQRYVGYSPYEKIPEYYAAGFWLFLSRPDGAYEPLQMSYSIEYWEDALDLVEVTFIDQGILQLEYFIGRSPFSNAQLQFRYDEEDRQFYVYRTYYRDAYDDSLLIGDADNYGRYAAMSSYFSSGWHFEGMWESADDVLMRDGTRMRYYSDSFQYQCEDLLEEHHINSLIWEKEYELIAALERCSPSGPSEVSVIADPSFYGKQIVSGQITLHLDDRNITMPVMVDRQRGEIVTVTGLLDKGLFLEIFERWSCDQLPDTETSDAFRAQIAERVGECWERADLVEDRLGEQEKTLYLQIVQEGIRTGYWTQGRLSYFIIDKEYFWGTPVWAYF